MTTDIAETIARLRDLDAEATPGPWEGDGRHIVITNELGWVLGRIADAGEHDVSLIVTVRNHLTKLLDAAEAAVTARDAALEEAAAIADRWAKDASDDDMQDRRDLGDDYDPNCYGSGYNCGVCESGVQIAEEIRALRSKPAAPSARDAALEEAAQIAECNVFTGPDDSDPRIAEAHNGAVRWTAHLIRALRSKS